MTWILLRWDGSTRDVTCACTQEMYKSTLLNAISPRPNTPYANLETLPQSLFRLADLPRPPLAPINAKKRAHAHACNGGEHVLEDPAQPRSRKLDGRLSVQLEDVHLKALRCMRDE